VVYLRYINDGIYNAAFNMAVDRYLFSESIKANDPNPILRIYRFENPSVTVGCGKNNVLPDYLAKTKIAQRPTGGGVVCHGEDLIYSVIVPFRLFDKLSHVLESYGEIHSVLIKALSEVGAEAELFSVGTKSTPQDLCFQKPVLYDVMCCGRKIAGAGQKRSLGFLLHQGSIALDVLRELNRNISEIKLRQSLANAFGNYFCCELREIPLVQEEISAWEGKEAIIPEPHMV